MDNMDKLIVDMIKDVLKMTWAIIKIAQGNQEERRKKSRKKRKSGE